MTEHEIYAALDVFASAVPDCRQMGALEIARTGYPAALRELLRLRKALVEIKEHEDVEGCHGSVWDLAREALEK